MIGKKDSFFIKDPKFSFWIGVVTGVAVFSIIGFIILLTQFLSDGDGFANKKDKIAKNDAVNAPPADVGGASTGEEFYNELAKSLGMDAKQFSACVAGNKYADKVESQYQNGITLGVRGTPASFVNGQLVSGAVPFEQLKQVIDSNLTGGSDAAGGDRADIQITDQDHVIGGVNAKVAIVEFSDFQCPFCQRFHPTMQRVLQEYGDDVKWVYRHFPLDSIHPRARPSAAASECAAEQDKFWEFMNALFANQDRI